jgi:hypothetical protein
MADALAMEAAMRFSVDVEQHVEAFKDADGRDRLRSQLFMRVIDSTLDASYRFPIRLSHKVHESNSARATLAMRHRTAKETHAVS